ncbi:uncharacterized protein moto [Hippoglossus hippoglossus]|uniref:uncharacterized protein moto n=1 Tax=Hippoglossus hippoglossus TaxID=8267 RepID=UPI00148D094B|nr:uncharacterized protein moto [Hippoglossus hippoglossus]XP_034449289.1 uncharacterized protein moto [Hippoglossus hippoglossus]XP_034449290.1 uncharacterized protein moto [Hippoglossus hippoglossus]
MEPRIRSGSMDFGAFDGHQSLFANSLFPSHQRQASVNVGCGNSGKTTSPSLSVPGVLMQDKDTASNVPWSHNAHDDPYQLFNSVQRSTRTRKPTDDMNYDGETVLQGLVSNILDEANSRHSYTERTPATYFQSFMGGDHDSFCRRDFPNMCEPTYGMLHEDSLFEQWKITSPTVSSQSTPAMLTPKQPVGEFSIVQRERNGGVRKQIFKRDASQNYLQEHIKQQEPLSPAVNLPNQYQNKVTPYRGNIGSVHQYSKHHIPQSQMRDKFKPQIQREKKMAHMPGILGEGFSTRPLSNTYTRDGDKKQVFPQKPWFDHQGGSQSQRFNRENGMFRAGNSEQYIPPMSPESDLRGHPSIPLNISLRSNGSAGPGEDVREMMTRSAENTYYGRSSAATTPMAMNQEGSAIQLLVFHDECNEQWKCLSMERKMIETILTKMFVGKWTAALINAIIPQTPPNPTRVDHLIVRQMMEHAEVASLLYRMEYLCNIPIHINIRTALNKYHEAVCGTQARRKQLATMSKPQQQRGHITDSQDLLLVITLKHLAATTRKLRMALWCAVQMTLPLPPPVRRQDDHVNMKATCRNGHTSAFKGNSFRL